MCDDVERTMAELKAKGVRFTSPIADMGWGRLTMLEVPGGGQLGLYEPRHPTTTGRARPRGAKRRRKDAASKKKSKAKAGKKKTKNAKRAKPSQKKPGKGRRSKRGR